MSVLLLWAADRSSIRNECFHWSSRLIGRLLLRCVGRCGRRSRRLSGRTRRSGFGPPRSGETRRRESERDEQEAAEHVGGAADQEHAPAEGNTHTHTWSSWVDWGAWLSWRPTCLKLTWCHSCLQDLEVLSQELVRISKEGSPGGGAAGSGWDYRLVPSVLSLPSHYWSPQPEDVGRAQTNTWKQHFALDSST